MTSIDPLPEEAVTLLPCPFCGGEGELMLNGSSGLRLACVRCKTCQGQTQNIVHPVEQDDSQAEAITAWNTRIATSGGEASGVLRDALEREAILRDALDKLFVQAIQSDVNDRANDYGLQAIARARAALASIPPALPGSGEVERERDTAQSLVEAWAAVCESLEAHLEDRVAMQDQADPASYLSILRSSMANVERYSEQVRAARWTDYRRQEAKIADLEAMIAAAPQAASAGVRGGEVEAIIRGAAKNASNLHPETAAYNDGWNDGLAHILAALPSVSGEGK